MRFDICLKIAILSLLLCCSGCHFRREYVVKQVDIIQADTVKSLFSNHTSNETPLEKKMRDTGLVDIAGLDSAIAVHLVYATPYNFMGRRLYNGLTKAFMLPETARKLIEAKKRLKAIRPDLTLLVYDAARPLSVQREMWDMVKGTDMKNFVANPNNGPGMHNFGAAVDVTLMDCTGQPLPLGSCYDFFGYEARITDEQQLLDSARITRRELENRLLLRRVMTEAGFTTIQEEWWHFNIMPTAEARKKLIPID